MKEEIALFNDAMAHLTSHAVLVETVARIIKGTDPLPAEVDVWISSKGTTKDSARLAMAFQT
jgi:hypothetical protein